MPEIDGGLVSVFSSDLSFSRMRSEGFSFYSWGSGGWPVFAWPCFWRPQACASVRNRSQPSASVRLRPSWPQSCRAYGKSRKNVPFLTCQKMWSCRFAWQAWHFVTFQHVSQRVKSRFVWQAQYFCDVFTRCIAFFVAGAALWMSFCNKPLTNPE